MTGLIFSETIAERVGERLSRITGDLGIVGLIQIKLIELVTRIQNEAPQKYFSATTKINTESGQRKYTLPDDVISGVYAVYYLINGQYMPLNSHTDSTGFITVNENIVKSKFVDNPSYDFDGDSIVILTSFDIEANTDGLAIVYTKMPTLPDNQQLSSNERLVPGLPYTAYNAWIQMVILGLMQQDQFINRLGDIGKQDEITERAIQTCIESLVSRKQNKVYKAGIPKVLNW